MAANASGRDVTAVPDTASDASALSTGQLIAQIAQEGSALVKKEIELARAELTADVRREIGMAKAFGVGAIAAFCGLNMVFVTIALALSMVMAPWAAGLIVTGVLLLVAGILALLGWKRRVKNPLERTKLS